MNQLSIHGVTEITIEREIIRRDDSYMNPDEFTVINVIARDKKGTRTKLTCFVEPEYTIEPTTAIATNRVDLGDVPCVDVEVSHAE